ncbi:MAG: sigma-54 interaction domain-containing protein [Polymorphobacter sp.]
MGNCTPSITISAAVRRTHPELAAALIAAGLVLAANADVVLLPLATPAAEMSPNAIRVGVATAPHFAPASADSPATLLFDQADTAFAGALIAALVRGAAPTCADPASRALMAIAERVAPRDVSVLIGGPTGTGKEVLARHIHQLSPRRDCPLVAVNCAALPEAMLEALLFGHERGAFTGAASSARGLFRAAQGGTLLLDEIAELPLALQAKLLRALQEREVLPIGATVPVPIDVRVIAAANRDLGAEVRAGRFRADLYYRLAVFPMTTCALADRPADILALSATLLLRAAAGGNELRWPTPAALARLVAAPWPGNIRELDNVLQRALVLAGGARIEAHDLSFDAGVAAEPLVAPSLGGLVRERESAAIRAALVDCAGRRGEAAQRLGISERTLRYKLAAMAGGLPDGAHLARRPAPLETIQ